MGATERSLWHEIYRQTQWQYSFLPPAGRRSGATASYQDDNSGWYWSSTVYAEKSVWALLFMDETFVYTSYFPLEPIPSVV